MGLNEEVSKVVPSINTSIKNVCPRLGTPRRTDIAIVLVVYNIVMVAGLGIASSFRHKSL